MEAATPLRQARVAVLANRLIVDGLVVDDTTAVELVSRRTEAGDDPARVVADAIEIGARVLDREQTGAQADFVKAEFEKVSREVETAFAGQARDVAEKLDRRLRDALLRRLVAAVQHRIRAVVDEVSRKSREDLVKQFSSTDGANPLAQFQRSVLHVMKQGAGQQEEALDRMRKRLEDMQLEIARLHAEREKQLEVAAEAERGTAKGRTFEEAVAEALDRVALAQGDDCEAVGDLRGASGRKGDVVVGIEGCRGPARGTIVFEAKNSRMSRRGALEELDAARAERGADFAVLVVPGDEKVPAKMQPLREYNGDKMVVCFDPEDPASALSLEVAYALARARVLMAGSEAEGIDGGAIRESVERAVNTLGEVQKVKQQLTGATSSIEKAYGLVEGLAAQVRGHLAQIEALLDAGTPAAAKLFDE